MERSKEIFGNRMKDSVYRKAVNSRRKFQKKFGDDSRADYQVNLRENPHIGSRLGVWNVELGKQPGQEVFDTQKEIIVGNIRMGFGHWNSSWRMRIIWAACATPSCETDRRESMTALIG